MIRSSTELQERERTKLAAVDTAVRAALEERGCTPGLARATAQLATFAFTNAWEQWIEAQGRQTFAACLDAATADLHAALAAG